VLARSRRLDRGVEGKEVGALGQLANGDGDLAGAAHELGEAAHVGGDGLDAAAGLAHARDHRGDGFAALRGQALGFLGAGGNRQGVLGGASRVGTHVGGGARDVLDGSVLLFGRPRAGAGLRHETIDAREHRGRGLGRAARELAVAGQGRLAIAHRGVEPGHDAVELVVAGVECGVLVLQDRGVQLGLAPAHEQGDDLDDDEEGVHGDAPEGVGQGVLALAEDLRGRDDADHGVVEDDEAHRQRKRQPVEIEPDDRQHREEEEVRLDRAVREVDEHGRAGHQAERRDARAGAAREAAPAGQQRRDDERREVDQHVRDRAAVEQSVCRQRGDVEPEHHDDASVATLPQLVGDAGEPRQGVDKRAHAHAHVVGQCARVLSPERKAP
jgi:hypothetical protein